jgi:DNA polymerase sigma
MDETFLPFSSEESTLPENNKSIKINPSFPWIKNSSSNYHQIPSAIRFHNEIISFCKFVYPDQQDIIRREKILDRIQKVTKVLWESSLLKVFGSQLTRILTSTSDIDICILSVPTRDTVTGSTNSEVDCLHLLASKLKETRKFSYVEVISNAKVPIIKTDDLISGISIDICINNDSGLKTG